MHKVTVNGKTAYAADGTLLSDVLIRSGESVSHPCGGKGICKKCLVIVNGKEELSCRYIVKDDIDVTVFKEEDGITDEKVVLKDVTCLALDIGTTTLALAAVSLDDGRIIKAVTRDNPQCSFGADVISRIEYCRQNGITQLHKALICEINSMISEFALAKRAKLYASGNVTMLHTLFGIDCSSLGESPYTPAFLESKTVMAEEIGIKGVEVVCSLPSISAFVGADIVSGMGFIGRPKRGRHSLLLDLGTNAEIVLTGEESSLCTAAAAGPCFEGANISCGMSATSGAIYSYSKKEIGTINNAPAKGICGTGLIDVVAYLISENYVDKTGFMEEGSVEIADGVRIDQKDIRQYQLAKSAVCSAILTLMQLKNVSFDDIDKVYVSGGFSVKINIDNAVSTGLIPKELASKCVSLNNSSLLGTAKYAAEQTDLSYITDKAKYIDLSDNETFADLFIKNMAL